MGDPIIIWPPGRDDGSDPCASELGWGWYDCSEEYSYLLDAGEVACCQYF